MSSPRSAVACDAVLHRDDRATGPMRLPVEEPSQFIDEFNRRYASVGLAVRPLDELNTSEKEKHDGSM